MIKNARWLLPEGVEEILPAEAQQLELLRRSVLDELSGRGFQLVMPPVMEFVDSLLTRIGEQRELLQIGAEVFGETQVTADIEVIDAMLAALHLSKAQKITLSLGHVGLYRSLLKAQNVDSAVELRLRDIFSRKSRPDLELLSAELDIEPFVALLGLAGNQTLIQTGREIFANLDGASESLDDIQAVVDHLNQHPHISLHIDLADITGYRYHTGLMFTAFVSGRGRSIAQGGRYDRIGQEFGRARAATGFSADLKTLVKLQERKQSYT